MNELSSANSSGLVHPPDISALICRNVSSDVVDINNEQDLENEHAIGSEGIERDIAITLILREFAENNMRQHEMRKLRFVDNTKQLVIRRQRAWLQRFGKPVEVSLIISYSI